MSSEVHYTIRFPDAYPQNGGGDGWATGSSWPAFQNMAWAMLHLDCVF